VDLYCTKCGEPWALDCLQDADEYGLTVSGSTIVECGGCIGVPTGSTPSATALIASALHDLMPDDPDGVASMMDDADAWGLLS
jgi:hypothetical protein